MNDKRIKQEHNAPTDIHSDLDIDAICEQIWNDLQGKVNRAAIRQAILEILPEYKNARIRTYISILARREALELLQDDLSKATPDKLTRAPTI